MTGTLDNLPLLDGYELVHTVSDYYDDVVSGIATFQGAPHFYERVFDETASEYSDLFHLTPLSMESFNLGIESFEIFLRWREALNAGQTDLSTHPALPSDRERWCEIQDHLNENMKTIPVRAILVQGKVTTLGQRGRAFRALDALQAKWTIINR